MENAVLHARSKNVMTQEDRIEKRVEQARPARAARVARFLDPVIFYALLVVIALTAIPYGTVEPWWVGTFECLVFLLAMLALIEAFITKTLRLESLAVPLLVLTLFILFQSLRLFARANVGLIIVRGSLSADPYGTGLFAVKFFALVTAGLLFLKYTSTNRRLRALIYVVLGVGLASALFGILRLNVQQSPGFFLPYLTSERGFAQFVNKNHFAFLMEMTLGLIFGLLAGEAGRHRRVLFFLPVAAVLWVALILSNSRGGILASLCQVLFLGVLLDPVRHLTRERAKTSWNRFQNVAGGLALRAFLIVCLVALFAYGVGWVGGEPVVSNFELAGRDFRQQGADNNRNTSRSEIWSTTWKLIKDNPLVGAGFGGYWIAVTKFHNASGELTPQEAHNDYLELLASGGLIGSALVIWFVVAFLRKASERLHAPDPYCRAACLGALVGIFGVAIHSFVDFGLHITVNALIFTTLLVIAVQNDCVDDGRSSTNLVRKSLAPS